MVRSSRFENSSCQNDASSVLEWISLPCSVAQGKKYVVQIDPLVGEVLRAIHISEADFETLQEKLTGMCETSDKLAATVDPESAKTAILDVANMAQVETSDPQVLRFAAVTFSSNLPVFLMLKLSDGVTRLIVNSEKMVVNSMLLKTVKEAIST